MLAAEAPIDDRPAPDPLRAETAPRSTARPIGTAAAVVVLVAVALVAGMIGALVGHAGSASAAAETAQLRARLADAATAQARLTAQATEANDRLASQKTTEPLRRLVGRRVGEVQSYTGAHGWQLRVVRVHSRRASGTVLTQAPPAGHVMKPGAPIVVRVAA